MKLKVIIVAIISVICLSLGAQDTIDTVDIDTTTVMGDTTTVMGQFLAEELIDGYSNSELLLAVGGFVVLILLIVAIILQIGGKIVITQNPIDMILLVVAPICIVAAMYLKSEDMWSTFQLFLYLIAGTCIIGTLIFSFIDNKGNFGGVLLSIITKSVIIVIVAAIVVVVVVIIGLLIALVLGKFDKKTEPKKKKK